MAGLSVRYATALFELTREVGNVDESLEQAIYLRDTLSDPDCKRVISHPHISEAEKIDFFKNAFEGKVDEHLLGMVYLAISKDRESHLVQAFTAYIDMVNAYKLKTVANVVSAVPLTEGQVASLINTLSKKLNKQVEVVMRIDPAVMGGLTVYVDGYLIDRTLKKQFSDLKKELKAV
jgi:F-type H+-transporting ATPase subunit delta